MEGLEFSMELKFAGGVELEQRGAELALEHFGHGMDGEKPACLFGSGPGVLGGQSAAGDQTVQVRMIHEVLAPGVEDGGDTQFSLEALLAELQQCGAGAVEQCLIEGALILQGERAQRCRQGEDPVEIAHG